MEALVNLDLIVAARSATFLAGGQAWGLGWCWSVAADCKDDWSAPSDGHGTYGGGLCRPTRQGSGGW